MVQTLSLGAGRRLPPSHVASNVESLVSLCPDLGDDILSSVDQPLVVKHDPQANKSYLLCDYSKDGDSYRSPWSNAYDPPLPDGTFPSAKLRKLEEAANEAFDVYRDMSLPFASRAGDALRLCF
jgi:capping protein beta